MNPIFLSPGQDPFVHLQAHALAVPTAAFEGVWTTLELHPDLFARQRYTVGVLVGDRQGGFRFRLLEDLQKFECFMGKDAVASFKTMVAAMGRSLVSAQQEGTHPEALAFSSAHLCLGELWFTSGSSLDSVLNRLYSEVVPFLPGNKPMAGGRLRKLVSRLPNCDACRGS